MKVGLLGAGQLSRMLVEAAHRLGLRPVVFAESLEDPAAQISQDIVLGKISEIDALSEFFSKVDLVTYENDFLPYAALRAARHFSKPQFLPRLEILEQLQDKLAQKRLLEDLSIPVSFYEEFDEKSDVLGEWIRKHRSGDSVFKWTRGGYDGKGVNLSTNFDELSKFCQSALDRGLGVFVEKKILFKRELSIVSSYSSTGEFQSYPLVISEQDQGICKLVSGPACSLGVSKSLESRAEDYARALAVKLNLVGTFAIELFETVDGDLIVNEIAPRVHNTGHFSLDAADTSQFENHWRALLGLPLGGTSTSPCFLMLNLLGTDRATDSFPPLASHHHLHWYGKTENRHRRKMGHVNVVIDSIKDFDSEKKEILAWEQKKNES